MKLIIAWIVILAVYVRFTICCLNGFAGCQTCLNIHECGQCEIQYRLYQKYCHLCYDSSCLECFAHTTKCTKCMNGFRVEDEKCEACSDSHCLKCESNKDFCTICENQYVEDHGNCTKCETGCSKCEGTFNNCTECHRNYRLSSNICEQCTIHIQCKHCYINTSYCSECFDKFGVDNGNCRACEDNNCLECDYNYSNCNECKNGYGIQNQNFAPTCVLCHETCQKCSFNYENCTECKKGYKMILNRSTPESCYPCNQNIDGVDWCLTCNPSITNCLSCLVNSLICDNCTEHYGLYLYICLPCSSNNGCQDCLSTNYSHCITCSSGYFLNSIYSCTLCYPICLTCNSLTFCTSCQEGYYLDTRDNMCYQCPENCLTCEFNTLISKPDCISCKIGYGLKNLVPKTCPEICGDFITHILKCDNNITIEFDGCDEECEIENGFNCTTEINKVNATLCSYEKKLEIQIDSMEKEEFANKINLTINVYPPLHTFWDDSRQNRSLKEYQLFSFENEKIEIISTKYLKESHQFEFALELKESIINETLTLHFLPSNEFDDRYRLTPSSEINIKVDRIHYHPENIFYYANLVPYLCYTTISLTFVSFGLGILVKSLAGIENMILMQMFWFMFVWLNTDLFVPFTLIYPLKYVTGFGVKLISTENMINEQNDSLVSLSTLNEFSYISTISSESPHLSELKIDDKYFINNFNIEIILQIITLIIGIILFILLKKEEKLLEELKGKKRDGCEDEYVLEKINEWKMKIFRIEFWEELFLQLCLTFTIFNISNFVSSVCIFFKYSNQIKNPLNIVFIAISFIVFIAIFVMFYNEPCSFDYFRFLFKREFVPVNHLYFFCVSIISTILIFCFCKEFSWASVIPFTILFLYMIIYRPYKELKENIRSCLIIMLMITILSFRIYLQYSPKPINNKVTFILFFTLILLLNLISFATLCYLIYKMIFIYYIKNKRAKESIEEIVEEIDRIEIKEKIKYLNLSENNPFKIILHPNMNILDFSNEINQKVREHHENIETTNYHNNINRPCLTNHEDLYSGRKLRKDMNETEYVISHKNKSPKETSIYHNELISSKQQEEINKKISENVEEYLQIKNNESKSTNKSREIPKECALGVAVEENIFLNVKNAEQYTNKLKIHSYKLDESYLAAYNTIAE